MDLALHKISQIHVDHNNYKPCSVSKGRYEVDFTSREKNMRERSEALHLNL